MPESIHAFGGRAALALVAAALLLSSAALAEGDANSEFDVTRSIVYCKLDETELKLDAYVPRSDGLHPAILVVHGGAWRSGNKYQLARYARMLSERGYVAFAINYRLAPKYLFPAQIEDCRAAVRWIRENAEKYKVDPARVGAIGYSAGGHLVSLLATTGEAPSAENGNVDTRLQAVVAGGAPCEFREIELNKRGLAYWLGGTRSEKPAVYRDASPTAFVDKHDAPILFYNGTNDQLVPLDWTRPLYDALKSHDIPTEFIEIEGAGHLTAAANMDALGKAWAFFDKHLKVAATGE